MNANSTAALGNSSATNTLIFEDGGILQAAGAITSASTRGVTLNTTAASTFTIDTNGNDMSIAGVIGGTGGLTKTGAGTLTLSGANTFSPNSTSQVNAGTLLATRFAALPLVANSGWFVNPGATLAVRAGGAGEWTSANLDTLLNVSGLTSNNFDVDTFLGIEVTGSNTFIYAHDIAGDQATKGLIKMGTGTLTLSGANTYTDLTTVSAGALNIGSSGSLNEGNALTISASGTANFANAGQNLGAVSNSNTAANALNFSATTGTVTLDSLTGAGATRFGSNGIVTNGIAEGTVTSVGNLNADISGGTVSAGTLTSSSITGGTNTVTGTAGITTLDGGITTVGGVATIGTMTSGTANLNGATSAITTLNGGTVNLGTSTVLTVSGGSTSGSITGTGGSLVKNTGGTLTLAGTNSYTGLTTVSAGALIISSSGSLNSGNALTLDASGTANFANAGQTLGAVSNSNTAANALNFSATTGTVTLASLTGPGATRFGSNGIITGGIASGTVTSVGNLTTNISGGITTVGGVATIGMMTSGTANLNGNTSAITTLNGGTVNLGASTVLTVSGGSTLGSITGSGGSLVKETGSTLTLSGTNSYTGGTTVSNGMLLVNGTLTGTVGVSSAATLGGTGTISGAVSVDGILSPGASIAKLTTGSLTLSDGSTFAYEMNHSALPSAAGDLQIVNGNLSLIGNVNLTLADLAGLTGAFDPNTTKLSLIQYAGTWNGGFFTYGDSNVLENNEVFTDAYNNQWKITYNADAGGLNFASSIPGSHFITLSNLTAIPEPASLLALGCLVGSGAFLRSRRRIR